MPERAKVGDTVVCIDGRSNLTVGVLYKVHALMETNSGLCYRVTGDDGTPHCSFYARRFKIYESPATTDGAIEYEEAMAAQDIMDNLNV